MVTTTTPQDTAAEQQVRSVIDAVYEAWTANDADAFVTHYAPDATAALPGSFRDGRERIRAAMAAGFEGPLKGSTIRDEIHSVRFLGESRDAAVVVARSTVVLAGETDVPEDRWVRVTWALERTGADGWLVVAYHNCAD
ncbi:SgcJ/EcaC family oxidoreductase [Streptomyces sp. NRRL B-24572]|uniref:SgcJ/EcaC family oxidoreductase n=1 Tax=Streptomyces sp. NRRL B-24572 TaxID=1962156 RepID=UPI000A3C0CF7|nr:SgcJ/EcaC family oxidoreductase [Streptomyces sp. NRRL B-24572]